MLDQRHRALADVLAPQVGDAVLGDDVVDVAAAGDHAGALLEARPDAADGAVLGASSAGR